MGKEMNTTKSARIKTGIDDYKKSFRTLNDS